jgi:hypothetical protein
MKEKEGDKLAAWCDEVINDDDENIKGFAKGILNDFQAVYRCGEPSRFYFKLE